MSEQNQVESLGNYLKVSREGKGVSIEQVAYATRISLKMLSALEEDDHSALPAPTFVRGYLQAYAKYVRIDSQDLLLRYQHHLAVAPDTKKASIHSHYLYVNERYQEKKRLMLVIVLFVAMLGVAGTYFLLKAKRERNKRLAQQAEQIQKSESLSPEEKLAALAAIERESKEGKENKESKDAKDSKDAKESKEVKAEKKDAEPAKAEKSNEKQAEKTPAAPAVAATAAPAVPAPTKPATTESTSQNQSAAAAAQITEQGDTKRQYNLLVRAEQDVWIRFQTDSDEVKDLTLRSGKSLMLRANKVIKIFSGNLGSLKATFNGKEIGSLATPDRAMSAVLPETEVKNYPLPLFPQFQKKSEGTAANPPAAAPQATKN